MSCLASGASPVAGKGAFCWSWHQSQSEGWWTCGSNLWWAALFFNDKLIASCLFLSSLLSLGYYVFYSCIMLLLSFSYPSGHLQSPGCLLPEVWVLNSSSSAWKCQSYICVKIYAHAVVSKMLIWTVHSSSCWLLNVQCRCRFLMTCKLSSSVSM